VIADAENAVIAFARLAMTGIDRSAAPDALANGAADPEPALLVGRLAVDRAFAGLGIATALVAYLVATAVELNAAAACRAVVATALNPAARPGGSASASDRWSPTASICTS
jgi:GNAT superfamily N-acetyltransferase